jgi:O-succinylbenzoic acid--CoA ligase
VDAVSGPAVDHTLLPALRAAMAGGPPVLPLPLDATRPSTARLSRLDFPPAGRDGSPIALVVPTSGSTGVPKGVLLSVDALRASGLATQARLGGPGTWLLALPTTHVAGLQVLLRADLAGSEPVCLDLSGGFDVDRFTGAAAACRDRAAGSRTYTSLVPTQLIRILDAGRTASNALAGFDAVLVGAAATPRALLDRAVAAGIRVVTTYGMSETCGGCIYDGLPLDGVRVTTGDDGRISLAGPVVFSGYAGDPAATADVLHGDRFDTSDRGGFQDGLVTVLGRLDAVIISGGENISPEGVERALLTDPRVAAALVLGVPDDQWGQAVAAAVVAADPADPPTLAELRERVSTAFGRAAAPRRLLVLDELPTLALGKPDRRRLAALLAEPPTLRHESGA